METDFYKLLEISPGANEATIRKAWRKKTRETHPDVNASGDAAQQFMVLKEALDTLLDPVLRLKHDRHFGYYSKPKNQNANTKQQYSEFQKHKAETIVNAWKNDYDVAMRMREEQRQRVIAKHKRNRRIVLIVLMAAIAALAAWLALAR